MAWAAATLVATAAGPVVLAVVLAPVAALAAAQAARSWRRRQRRPAWKVSAGGAGLLVLGSTVGPIGAAAAVVLISVLLAVAMVLEGRAAGSRHRRRAAPLLTALIAVGFGMAGAAPVLLRGDGLVPAFVLFGFVHAYDASAYVVGSGAGAAWEGPAAGVASIAAVTLAVAAILSPPFRGASPLLFGLLAGALTPLGPKLASHLLGNPRARVPALRRLDSLLLLGPVWALAAALVLD